MRIGLDLAQQRMPFAEVVGRARYAEEAGFDGVWGFDHFQPMYGEGPGECFEGNTTLAALSGHTDRVRLGLLVTGVTYRHPSVFAAEAMTIDHASDGRLDLSLGAAWFWAEHETLGIAFPDTSTRIEMLDEALTIVKGLLTTDGFSFEGRHWTVEGATLRPRPVQAPHPPIWVGASGERKMIPLAARHADVWHTYDEPDTYRRKSALIDQHAEAAGRDPATIGRAAGLSLSEPWDEVRANADAIIAAGATELICGWPSEGRERIDEFVATLLPDLRRGRTNESRLTARAGGRERASVGNPFHDGTAVTRDGDGHYTATIDEVWNLRPLPQGGLVTALALRAMAAELDDPRQTVRTLHTAFAAQVASGPVDVDVEVLRRGRSMSQVRGEVRNTGAPRGHLTTAVFGAPRDGYDFTDLRPPTGAPHPDDCPSFRDPPPDEFEMKFPPMRFWDEVVDGRPALGHAPWEDYVAERAERAAWHRFDEPPWLDDGTIDPLSLVVLADVMPGAASEFLGPPKEGDRFWFAPSVDLTVHLLAPCRSPWVLSHNTARFAGDGYVSADMALWDHGPDCDEEPRLVAYGTQLFFFSFIDPPGA